MDELIGADQTVTILADDLTGAADACAPLTEGGRTPRVHLSLDATPRADSRIHSFDGRMRELDDDAARAVVMDFARLVDRADTAGGLVCLKVDSATRGHVARDVATLLDCMTRFRGAVVTPAYPAQGRLFRNGRALGDGAETARSIREDLEALGCPAAILSDLSGGEETVGERIDAALDGGCRAILVDTGSQDDLRRLAPVLLRRRHDLVAVGSAGLIEAMAGGPGIRRDLNADQMTCLFGTRSHASRLQLDAFERQSGAVRVSERPEGWRRLADGRYLAMLDAAFETGTRRIMDIRTQLEADPAERPAESLARAIAPYADRLGLAVMSGGDTARAVLEALGIRAFDVIGTFEAGIPICRADELRDPFLLKSGGFGDPGTLTRLSQTMLDTEVAE